MGEQLRPHNSQNYETRWQRAWRRFKYHVEAPALMALGLGSTLIFGYVEGARIVQGEFGQVTDPQEMSKLLSGDFHAATNPEQNLPIETNGGWILDLYLGTGFAAGSGMLGYGIYLRRANRDRI